MNFLPYGDPDDFDDDVPGASTSARATSSPQVPSSAAIQVVVDTTNPALSLIPPPAIVPPISGTTVQPQPSSSSSGGQGSALVDVSVSDAMAAGTTEKPDNARSRIRPKDLGTIVIDEEPDTKDAEADTKDDNSKQLNPTDAATQDNPEEQSRQDQDVPSPIVIAPVSESDEAKESDGSSREGGAVGGASASGATATTSQDPTTANKPDDSATKRDERRRKTRALRSDVAIPTHARSAVPIFLDDQVLYSMLE